MHFTIYTEIYGKYMVLVRMEVSCISNEGKLKAFVARIKLAKEVLHSEGRWYERE